jgi:hypothetical protein
MTNDGANAVEKLAEVCKWACLADAPELCTHIFHQFLATQGIAMSYFKSKVRLTESLFDMLQIEVPDGDEGPGQEQGQDSSNGQVNNTGGGWDENNREGADHE